MPNCSNFENANDKVLVFISKKLIEDDFNYENPYEGGLGSKNPYHLLESVLKFFGESSVSDTDVEFFSKFIEYNLSYLTSEDPEKSYYDKLIIPQCDTFKFHYTLDTRIYQTEKYEDTWHSYDKSWVEDGVFSALRNGSWDYFEGKLIDEDVYDSESDNFEMKNVFKSSNVREQINSLDKTTLLEIRKLIDKKLRS